MEAVCFSETLVSINKSTHFTAVNSSKNLQKLHFDHFLEEHFQRFTAVRTSDVTQTRRPASIVLMF
jgi:hypothetical protein